MRTTRRDFITAVSALGAFGLVNGCGPRSNGPRPFTVASWGGAYEDMQQAAFFAPYAEKSGLTIAMTSPPDLARLDSMVTSGRTDWDLAVLDGRSHWRAIDRGLLEPLDVGKIPNIGAIRPEFRTPYGVVTSTGASVIAWSRHGFADATPTRWADFWDLERFPGKRGMYHGLYWNYEVAMLALGVPSRDIYPVTDDKMDRALDHLARLKPHVAVWWRSGPQPAQLLSSGEVALTSAWSGRMLAAIAAGAPVAYTMNQAIAWGSLFSIPKGALYVDHAHALIDLALSVSAQRKLIDLNVYGPVREDAAAMADPEQRLRLIMAPQTIDGVHLLNDREGAAYSDKYEERWNQFLLS